LSANAQALKPWETVRIQSGSNNISITGTPARHGPPHADRGPVVGFVLEIDGSDKAVYFSGDTVWYEGVAEVGTRFNIVLAVLFMGAACVPEVGPDHLTFTADEGVEFAKAFPQAKIIPVHYEGWAHFVESHSEIDDAFRAAGIDDRVVWLEAGFSTCLEI